MDIINDITPIENDESSNTAVIAIASTAVLVAAAFVYNKFRGGDKTEPILETLTS
jgi:hypothetical protein